MSVRITEVSCSLCDFKSSTGFVYGAFKYLLSNDQIITADRVTGLCKSCNKIRPIECFPDEATIINEINNRNLKLKDLQRLSIKSIFPSRKREIVDLKAELQELEGKLLFINNRKGPPRCLICGDKDVYRLDFSSPEKEVRHPGCGGILIRKATNTRLLIRFMSRLYDVEGNKLQEHYLDEL